MSVIVKNIKERPSPDIAWYIFSSRYQDLLKTFNITFDVAEPDLLTRTTIINFPDQETRDAWRAHPVVVEELTNLQTYNTANKITETITILSS